MKQFFITKSKAQELDLISYTVWLLRTQGKNKKNHQKHLKFNPHKKKTQKKKIQSFRIYNTQLDIIFKNFPSCQIDHQKTKVEKLENFTFEFDQSDETQIGNGNKN